MRAGRGAGNTIPVAYPLTCPESITVWLYSPQLSQLNLLKKRGRAWRSGPRKKYMKDEQEAVGESMRALTQFFVNDGTLGDTLLRVSEMACEFTPAKYAGITLMVEGSPRTGVFTNAEAPEIDKAQYESGEGPCMYAFRDQEPYRIDSTLADARWPEFSRRAAAHGILSTLSVPLAARGRNLGALNLYSEWRMPLPRHTSGPSGCLPIKPVLRSPMPRSTGTPGSSMRTSPRPSSRERRSVRRSGS